MAGRMEHFLLGVVDSIRAIRRIVSGQGLARAHHSRVCVGAIVMPAMVCLTWLFVGATAIDLELQGIAGGSIVNADISAQLFAMINLMLSPDLAVALSVVVVLLLLTFLITSADSGILIINTLASGGSQSQKGAAHIVIWGFIFALLIGALLAGGNGCSAPAMIVGAFTLFNRDGSNGHRADQG